MLTGIPSGHGESFNVLRYESNQHYDSHFDAFDEAAYGKQPSQRVRFGVLAFLLPFRSRLVCPALLLINSLAAKPSTSLIPNPSQCSLYSICADSNGAGVPV